MIDSVKKRSQHRLKIIKGHVNALETMIDDEKYCMDILTQSLAIQKSLSSLSKLILDNHIQTHVAHMMSSSDTKQVEKAIEELRQLYDLHNIRGMT